ncbi:MAG: hypothetical protein Q3982_07330 [Phoenicibacter congonensis]|uniref:Dipeptidase n=1 Tax=Phoenicibacter congonensis TaxID=1944646 RepID=A0AA43RJM6_9ACTN|nr:hypothetical protein [Phoenicibacter congonensis]
MSEKYDYMPSCDTVAIPASDTAKGCNLLGKNSDREMTEAQPLAYYPAADHRTGETVKCTYIEIEQVPHTYGMIGSRPWWIWGFEMGVNEQGVAIGNEAEWSEVPPREEPALLGMDLLRLGLERGATAKEALQVIIQLLERHGQGGACRYGGDAVKSGYHNTFIISDPKEMYLMETVGKHWVYRSIKKAEGISNIYKIGEDYEACSDGIEAYAAELGLHTPGQTFDFSKSFLLLNNHFMGGFPRSKWTTWKLQNNLGKIDAEMTLDILRGHYEGTFMENYWSPVSCCVPSVCMHGGEPAHTQSAATMVVEYHHSEFKELLYTYWGSMCPPCCSFIVPFYNTGYIPERLGIGENHYQEDSFWWKMQRLVTDAESDYTRYHEKIQQAQKRLEPEFRSAAAETEAQAEDLLKQGKREEACRLLNALTERCLEKVEQEAERLTAEIEGEMSVYPPQSYRNKMQQFYREQVKL